MKPDHQLVQDTLNGRSHAFDMLTNRYNALIFRIALDILQNREEAQNTAQETFMQAYINLGSLQSRDLFRPWLCRIGRNTALKRLRAQKRMHSLDDLAERHPLVQDKLHPLWGRPPETPEEIVENQERSRELLAALNDLPEKSRETLILFYIEDYSYRDIARFLNISTSAVQSRLQVARQRLRNTTRIRQILGPAPDAQTLEKTFERRMNAIRRSLGMQLEQNAQTRYENALATFADKLQQDHHVLAAIVYGSFSYDQVWEKSDLDIWIILKDGVKAQPGHCFVEDGVLISASIVPRSKFKRFLEGQRQGSWLDFTFSRSKLLFSKDESIATWYEHADHIGEKDRELQLCKETLTIFGALSKSEKWFYIKKDFNYSFIWLMFVVERLAKIETILNNEAPGREVIHQALRLNPDLFVRIYTELINKRKTEALILEALEAIDTYLEERIPILFAPLLDYLTEADSPRTLSDLQSHFKPYRMGDFAFACEWLVEKNTLDKTESPTYLTPKSRFPLEEPAYACALDEDWE